MWTVSATKSPAPTDNGQPAKAGPSVIRRVEGAEETAHERLVRKHVPAWVISGAIHVVVIAFAILIFGGRGSDAKQPDKIIATSVEKEPEEPEKDLTNEDPGLQSNLEAALPEIDRVDKQNVDAAVTNDTIGVPNTEATDSAALAPPGLAPTDTNNFGVAGTEGSFLAGAGGAGGMMNSSFPGRSGATKSKLLKEGGGNEDSERAVAMGLAWLAKQQKADGSWVYDGNDGKEVAAATGMGLLPFLAAGQTHKTGKYQKTVHSGIMWLIKKMSLSGPAAGELSKNMYAQAIATLPLVECYGMTKDKTLLLAPAQAAINYIQRAQGANGSWGYGFGSTGDTSIVGWQIQALKAAVLAKDIVVDDKVIKKAMEFLDFVGAGSRKSSYGYTSPAGAGPATSLTAVGLLCRYYSSGWGPNNASMAEGVEGLLKRQPKKGGQLDMYYYYYATQVVHFFEGDEWKTWNEGPLVNGKREGGMRDWLISLQVRKDGTPNHGSWDADAAHIGRACGRLGTTCMVLLTLEVYYRHLPLYKRDNGGLAEMER